MAENEPGTEPEAKTIRHVVPRVVEALATVPWAITEDALATIVSIANRENDVSPEALEKYRARTVAGQDMLTSRDGVAIIRVQGPIFRYGDLFTAISGAATYEGIASAIGKVEQDRATFKAALFHWDSPGGEVNGCAETAQMISRLATILPVESYVGGQACSAAYWLASATPRITIDRTALLGSIGVRMGIRDSSERDAKSGIRTIEFISSNAPNKRTDWNSDEGRARIQRMADQLEAVFVSDVAANRGVSVDDVIAKFGAGGVEVGTDAVSAGMADALGSFEGLLSKLASGSGRTVQGRKLTMTQTTDAPSFTHTQAQLDAASTTAKTQGLQEGAAAAQERISTILASAEGKANAPLAEHFAFRTTMDAAAAVEALKAAGPAAAQTPVVDTTKPTPPAPTGARSQDVAGGLALGTVVEGNRQPEAPKGPTLSASGIYAKRNDAMGAN